MYVPLIPVYMYSMWSVLQHEKTQKYMKTSYKKEPYLFIYLFII